MLRMLGFFVLTVLALPNSALRGQSLYVLSDLYIDEASGNVTGTATTSTDYYTSFYYDIGVNLSLRIIPQYGSPYYACSNWNSTNSSSSVSSSCSTNLGTQFADVELASYHWLDATYYYYQLQYCSWECYYFADYYGFSFLGTSGTYYDNQYFYAPGQTTPSSQRTTKSANLYKTKARGGCTYPSSETVYGWGWNAYNAYAAQFLQVLNGGSFNNRIVSEVFPSQGTDTCWRPSNGGQPVTTLAPGSWLVNFIKAMDYNGFASFSFNYSNGWGFDHLGFYGSGGANLLSSYVQNVRNQGGGSCSLNFSQYMYMYCGLYSTSNGGAYYKFNNPLVITVNATGTSALLNSQRSGIDQSRNIP